MQRSAVDRTQFRLIIVAMALAAATLAPIWMLAKLLS